MTMKLWGFAVAASLAAACGSETPTTPTPPVEDTRIMRLSGNLNFGIVDVGATVDRTLTVTNEGTAPLTITGLTGPASAVGAYQSSGATATIAAGAAHPIRIMFSPPRPIDYAGTLTVQGNHTGGTNTAPFTGTGIRTGPLWTLSGRGNTVFDVPIYIERLQVHGVWNRRGTSNFIVRLNGSGMVNAILRDSITYDGIHLAPGGGQIAITSSENIDWTFTESR